MIVSLHVATGAALGVAVRRPLAAIALGPLLHIVSDRIPHQDIASRRFEVASGVAAVAALAARYGPFHPVTLCALATCSPDAEHLVRLPRPGGRKLFPSHRFTGWHQAGGLSAALQLVVAGILLGAVVSAGPRDAR